MLWVALSYLPDLPNLKFNTTMLDSIKERVSDFVQSDGVRDLTTKAQEGLAAAGKGLQRGADSVKSFAASDDLKSVLPYLLSGGAGAVLGGMASKRQREEEGEERSSYLSRVLRNALLAGGVAAGGHYLVNKGLGSTVGSIANDGGGEGAASTMTKNIAFSPLTALGVGGSALYATQKMPGIGAKVGIDDNMAHMLANTKDHFRASGGVGDLTEKRLRAMTAGEIGNLERAAMKATGGTYSDRARRMAGLASDVVDPKRHLEGFMGLDKIPNKYLDMTPGLKGIQDRDEQLRALKGFLSTASRKHLASTFGQSGMRRTGRGALGLVAAGVPAMIGALLTRESNA
jgi:hypothetical protein